MILIRYGDRGPYVEMMQLALYRAGYLDEKPDGVFGDETRRALVFFQRDYRLSADGVMGEKTFGELRQYISGYRYLRAARGDSFESIAKYYNTTVEALRTANPSLGEEPKEGQRVTVPYRFTLSTSEISYSALLTALITEGLAARYPFIGRFSYGKSVLGRELYGLRIGKGEKVFVNASHHANEWITTPVVLRFIENYAEAVSKGGEIGVYGAKELFEKAELVTAPLVNPDGVDLVTGVFGKGSPVYKRCEAMNKFDISFPKGWKANIAGTDLNLNYPAGWEKAKEIKYALGFTSPSPRDFVGDYPLSAPESRALAALTERSDFALTLSYHTQGKTIYWKYLDRVPPYSEKIAKFFSDVSGYKYEETPTESGYAGYKDWFIDKYFRPGYTIEAGEGENPLPLAQFDEIYNDNEGILSGALALAAGAK